VPDFSIGWDQTVVRLVIAAALGGAIGLERELDDQSAGLRTHMLVASGSALFTLVGAYGFSTFFAHGRVVSFDPSRVAAQIVTGIGFLGAGVIFRSGFSVRGLTTAASLWLVAGIGMASGAGYWAGAILATAVGIVSLRPLGWLKRWLPIEDGSASQLVVELTEDGSSGHVVEAVERVGDVVALRRDGRRLAIQLRIAGDRRTRALSDVVMLNGVREAYWAR
jgi:putative Mg2+ transporter-C (MgtC) family protein